MGLIAGQITPATLSGTTFPTIINMPDGYPGRAGTTSFRQTPSVKPGSGAALTTYRPVNAPANAASTVAPLRSFGSDIYFRIWVIPTILDVQNPQFETPIEFKIWSSYLTSNELVTLGEIDATGIDLDVVPTTVWQALEVKSIHATIHPEAGYTIDANYLFDFQYGDGSLNLLAVLADVLPLNPVDTIVEKLEWLTDVLTSYDGTDQRIALRDRPRRILEVELPIENDRDRKELFDKLFKVAKASILIPAYQYQARLKQATVVADNKLYTNVRRADLRAGENVVIRTRAGETFLYKVQAVFADHITISTAFSQVIPEGSIVCAAFAGHFPDKTMITMSYNSGSSKIMVTIDDSRAQVAWPDNGVTVPAFKGKPLLLRRPIDEVQESIEVGQEVIDNQTGKPAYYSNWIQPFVEGPRRYLVQSLFDQDDLEFWREFLGAVRGRQKAFYTPSYRGDLVYKEGTTFFPGQIEVEGSEYASLYFPHETYKQLHIETNLGDFNVAVSLVENLGTSTIIHFATPIATDLTGVVVNKISFLLLVRMGNDTVSLTHQNTYATVDISLRTAVE